MTSLAAVLHSRRTGVAHGGALEARLCWALCEGGDLHPAANVAKMAGGHPLTDDDRWPWLLRLRDWTDERVAAAEPCPLACSALPWNACSRRTRR
jgi:carbohydrate kinase (thermoresistant glucokinase family)